MVQYPQQPCRKTTLIIRAHSFPRKFDKFRGEFRKFRGSPRQYRWNSAVHPR